MVTGHLQRVINNIDGHIKLVLEVLNINHKEYLYRRNNLIYKLHTVDKATQGFLAFKFNMSKMKISQICKMIEDSYKEENIIIRADRCFLVQQAGAHPGSDTGKCFKCNEACGGHLADSRALLFENTDKQLFDRLSVFKSFVIDDYNSQFPQITIPACNKHRDNLSKMLDFMSMSAFNITTGKFILTKYMLENL